LILFLTNKGTENPVRSLLNSCQYPPWINTNIGASEIYNYFNVMDKNVDKKVDKKRYQFARK